MIKQLIFTALLMSIVFSSCMMGNRPFPKRYLGTYEGTQDAYEINVNGEVIEVPEAEYSLELAYDELWLTTEEQVIKGRYELDAETEMYYALTVHLKNGTTEEWQLWKKGKRLIRKAMPPKPEIVLVQ